MAKKTLFIALIASSLVSISSYAGCNPASTCYVDKIANVLQTQITNIQKSPSVATTYGYFYYSGSMIFTEPTIPFGNTGAVFSGGISNSGGTFTITDAGVYEITIGGSETGVGYNFKLQINGVGISQPGTVVYISSSTQSSSATSLQVLSAADTIKVNLDPPDNISIEAFISIKKIA